MTREENYRLELCVVLHRISLIYFYFYHNSLKKVQYENTISLYGSVYNDLWLSLLGLV